MTPPATSTPATQGIFLVHCSDFEEYLLRMDEIILSILHPQPTGPESKKGTDQKQNSTWNRWETGTDTQSVACFKRNFFTSNADLRPETFLRVHRWLKGLTHGYDNANNPAPDHNHQSYGSRWSDLCWTEDDRAEANKEATGLKNTDVDSLYKYVQVIRPVGYWW